MLRRRVDALEEKTDSKTNMSHAKQLASREEATNEKLGEMGRTFAEIQASLAEIHRMMEIVLCLVCFLAVALVPYLFVIAKVFGLI